MNGSIKAKVPSVAPAFVACLATGLVAALLFNLCEQLIFAKLSPEYFHLMRFWGWAPRQATSGAIVRGVSGGVWEGCLLGALFGGAVVRRPDALRLKSAIRLILVTILTLAVLQFVVWAAYRQPGMYYGDPQLVPGFDQLSEAAKTQFSLVMFASETNPCLVILVALYPAALFLGPFTKKGKSGERAASTPEADYLEKIVSQTVPLRWIFVAVSGAAFPCLSVAIDVYVPRSPDWLVRAGVGLFFCLPVVGSDGLISSTYCANLTSKRLSLNLDVGAKSEFRRFEAVMTVQSLIIWVLACVTVWITIRYGTDSNQFLIAYVASFALILVKIATIGVHRRLAARRFHRVEAPPTLGK